MASESQPPPFPNPTTPLAWLPPALASQFEVARYLLVATCGVSDCRTRVTRVFTTTPPIDVFLGHSCKHEERLESPDEAPCPLPYYCLFLFAVKNLKLGSVLQILKELFPRITSFAYLITSTAFMSTPFFNW
jgi:hypothetical protein